MIRHFEDRDAVAVVEVWHRSGRAAYPFLPTWQAFTLERAREVFRDVIRPRCDIWVGTRDERVVAFLAMAGSYIDRMYADPTEWRKGWGTRFVLLAKRLHPTGLELHTHQENHAARRLYERQGFRAVKFGLSPPPENAPDVEYHWRPSDLDDKADRDRAMTDSTFMAIAHRGASSYAPENTFVAFDLALSMGARHIELDVQETRDGHIVVIHDDTVDRTTNGAGPVSGHTLEALQALDAGSWFSKEFVGQQIPLFRDVLGRYQGRAHIHTEIKGRSTHLSQQTADLVRQHGMADQITITSFQKARLDAMRAYAPELPAGWLLAQVGDAEIVQARELGLRQICPRANIVTTELVDRLHADGFVVRAWGVATEALMRQVVQAGADGMTVNFPDKLIAYLTSLGR